MLCLFPSGQNRMMDTQSATCGCIYVLSAHLRVLDLVRELDRSNFSSEILLICLAHPQSKASSAGLRIPFYQKLDNMFSL